MSDRSRGGQSTSCPPRGQTFRMKKMETRRSNEILCILAVYCIQTYGTAWWFVVLGEVVRGNGSQRGTHVIARQFLAFVSQKGQQFLLLCFCQSSRCLK